MKKSITTDYLIIGAGIVGLTIARNIKQKHPKASITIIDKEQEVSQHASGRNSGVLHAGFYYTSDSLKAKFCREGNARWTEYCKEHNLKINACGKVVVAQKEEELSTLYELEKRGQANGVELSRIDEQQLTEIEPNAKTHTHALHVPSTAVIDPVEISLHLKAKLKEAGVNFYFSCPYVKREGDSNINAGEYNFSYGTVINCAGLYADKVAKDFGCSKHYTIIPFKGLYLKHQGTEKPLHTNIYPVPNLANPFLGVHFTVTVDGTVKIGPTAIPAFWREHYTWLNNFSMSEMLAILGWESKLFTTNAFNFRSLAFEEIKKYSRPYLIKQAMNMVQSIDPKSFNTWSKPGIRAQLLDKRDLKLVQDFVVEKNENSVHVLNAVSPAFTCSLPFADWVVENYLDT